MLEWFETDIVDAGGDVVAHVRREVYVRERLDTALRAYSTTGWLRSLRERRNTDRVTERAT